MRIGPGIFRRRLRSFLPLRLLPKELYEPKEASELDHADDAAELDVDLSKDVTDAALRFEDLESSRLDPRPRQPKDEGELDSSA